MAILNVTPDSFSDGGRFAELDLAIRQAEKLIGDGADIIDVGGESTRPRSGPVPAEVEIGRVVPVIKAVVGRFDVAVSVDTSKSEVAKAAVAAGAEIVNDISGLRFDEKIATVVAKHGCGLVLMHSRGEFESMHSQPPVDNIMSEVAADFRRSAAAAVTAGIKRERIALDVGIGFGKTLEQNLELIANLDKLIAEFREFPILVGASRKSFIGRLLGGAAPDERLSGSLATAVVAVWNGARILRVHDVKETIEAIAVAESIRLAARR